MKIVPFRVLGLVGLVGLFSCSVKEEEEDDPTVLATVTLSNSTDTLNDGKNEFTKQSSCTLETDSQLLTASLKAGNGATLKVKIRNFKVQSYTCSQPVDNRAAASVGSKYTDCGIEISVLESSSSSKLNTYNMYRETTDTSEFTYGGTCTINVTSAETKAKGDISCTKMVRTKLSDRYIFPISTTQIQPT